MEFLAYPGATDWLKVLTFGWLLTIARHFIGLFYSNIIGLFCVQASFSEDDYSHRQPFLFYTLLITQAFSHRVGTCLDGGTASTRCAITTLC